MPERNGNEKKITNTRANGHIVCGRELLTAGRYQEALDLFNTALYLDPANVRALQGRSLALTRLGRFGEALSAAETIFLHEENSPHAYNARGVCYQAMGFGDEAREAFEKAVDYGPDEASTHYNFACFWAAQGDAERCREHLTRAILLNRELIARAAADVDFKPYRREGWFLDILALE